MWLVSSLQTKPSTATLAAAMTMEENHIADAGSARGAGGRAADSDYFFSLAAIVCPRACGLSTQTFSRRFCSLFGVSPECCSILWRKLKVLKQI